MLGGAADPLLAAHDVGDAHLVVVDDDGEVVGREPVALEDDLVVGHRGGDPAADEVVEVELDVLGHEHAHHGRLVEARQQRPLLARLAVAEPVVAGRQLELLLLVAHLREPLAGAPALVGVALGEQPLDVGLVGVQALRLAVGGVGAAHIRALVPGQPQPVQRVEDLLLAVGAEPRPVGVLDAQHETAALLAREREVEQGHVCRADVRVSGRRGGDAQADRGGGRFAHDGPILGAAAAPPVRPAAGTARSPALPSVAGDEGVRQHADPLDLHLDPLAGDDRPDTGRRAGEDHVAREQGEGLRGVRDERGDARGPCPRSCRPGRPRRRGGSPARGRWCRGRSRSRGRAGRRCPCPWPAPTARRRAAGPER